MAEIVPGYVVSQQNQLQPSAFPVRTEIASYSPTSNDYTILCNASGGNITINLPTAVGIAGKMYNIKKIDSSANTVTIDASGSQTVDGSLTHVLTVQNESITVQGDGSNWVII